MVSLRKTWNDGTTSFHMVDPDTNTLLDMLASGWERGNRIEPKLNLPAWEGKEEAIPFMCK